MTNKMTESVGFPKVILGEIIKLLHPDRILLQPRPARMRNRFMVEIEKAFKEYREEIDAINKFYAPKDEDGEFIGVKNEDGTVDKSRFNIEQLDQEQAKLFLNDRQKLDQEDYIFELTDTNKILFDAISDILDNLDIEFKDSKEQAVYIFLCNKFKVDEV